MYVFFVAGHATTVEKRSWKNKVFNKKSDSYLRSYLTLRPLQNLTDRFPRFINSNVKSRNIMDRPYISSFLRYFFLTTKKKFPAVMRIFPIWRSSEFISRQSLACFTANTSRRAWRSWKAKSWGSERSISPNEGRLYDTLLNAFSLLRFTDYYFLQRCRFDSTRRAHSRARCLDCTQIFVISLS